MKQTGICPKCSSRRVAKGGGGWINTQSKERQLTRYLCVDCGYRETYENFPEKVIKNEDDGWEFVNPDAGPYR